MLLAIEFDNLHQILRSLYTEMMPLCGNMAGVAKGIVLEEMKSVVNINGLSMSDKERMDVIDRTYNAIRNYRDLVSYYTRKNISVSYLRAKKKKDTDRVMALYGSADERYW